MLLCPAQPCLAVTLRHPSQVANIRWRQEQTPPLWSPGPAPAQQAAMLLHAQLLSREFPKGWSIFQGRARHCQPHEAIPQTTCGKQPVRTPQKLTSMSFDHPALSFQNIKNTNIVSARLREMLARQPTSALSEEEVRSDFLPPTKRKPI